MLELNKRQKSVSIPPDLWDRVVFEYEVSAEYWAERGVRSPTGLIRHYIVDGMRRDHGDILDIKAMIQELRTIVLENLVDVHGQVSIVHRPVSNVHDELMEKWRADFDPNKANQGVQICAGTTRIFGLIFNNNLVNSSASIPRMGRPSDFRLNFLPNCRLISPTVAKSGANTTKCIRRHLSPRL